MKFYSSFPLTPNNYLTNRAINYGDGLFETMLVRNKKIALWDIHIGRLSEGLDRLKLESIPKALIYAKILSLISDDESYIVKLVLFRDDAKRGYGSDSSLIHYYITVNPYIKSKSNEYLTVSSVRLAKQKNLAGLKHLNRLEQVLAAQELNDSKYFDAIMLDSKQRVIETISKNIVMIKKDKLYTPKLNKCGVYGVALRWLQKQGYELKWKKIEFKSLQKYDGMMVCNSVQGFVSIANIDNKIEFKQVSPVANEIQENWKKYTN